MRHFVLFVIAPLLAGLFLVDGALALSIDDATGRRVDIPDHVARVFPAGPPASALLYAIAPAKMLGWAHAPDGLDHGYIAQPYAGLPQLGALTSRSGEVDAAALRRANPDLIVDVGTISPRYIEIAKRTEKETGLPYILLDGRIAALPATIRTLALALDVRPRGEVLATYSEKLLAEVRAGVAALPQGQQVRAYYGRGKDGLTTAGPGTIGAEFMELLGLRNVTSENAAQMYRVTPEQIRSWNPDVVIMLGDQAADAFRSDPRLRDLTQPPHRLFVSPTLPFGWVDGPPSPSRLLALRWLGNALYPKRFPGDIRGATRDFYRLFYQVDLTDPQLDELLR